MVTVYKLMIQSNFVKYCAANAGIAVFNPYKSFILKAKEY